VKLLGPCVLCGGKGIHPSKLLEVHLVNEYWSYCGIESQRAIVICLALLETVSHPGSGLRGEANCLPISSVMLGILIVVDVGSGAVQKEGTVTVSK
jgi:hypothetical protein